MGPHGGQFTVTNLLCSPQRASASRWPSLFWQPRSRPGLGGSGYERRQCPRTEILRLGRPFFTTLKTHSKLPFSKPHLSFPIYRSQDLLHVAAISRPADTQMQSERVTSSLPPNTLRETTSSGSSR